ncbi:MAG: SUMF1/EgtB/PvdO family nonheme iron enzyme [Magnetococcales bacterium]|nr:SUMF1/EgtB/PvdO family nonheme iron enzyme [Magnetococcales bacterium]
MAYTWLHLSDIHMGCRGEEIRRQVDAEFKPHLQKMVKRLGAPDMILLTGDLAFSGKEEEYKQLDAFLAALTGWIREIQPDAPPPIWVPVPGNHDLARPDRNDLVLDFANLKQVADGDESVRHGLGQRFFSKKNVQLIAPLFQAYQDWFAHKVKPGWEGRDFHLSHFPGDWCLELNLPDRFPLRLVGLNSAWMHLGDGFAHQKLGLFTQQLQAALGENKNLEFAQGPALLLLHHPPLTWFSSKALTRFKEEIYTPKRFHACLFGHMHDENTTVIFEAGGPPRYYLQAPSLFGVEKLGTSQEERRFGYGWGRVTQEGEIFTWPFLRGKHGGEQQFIWNSNFSGNVETGHPFRTKMQAVATVPTVDLKPWLRSLHDRTRHIKISGIGSGGGSGKNANLYPIEQLYTVLKSRDVVEGGDPLRAEEVNLADLLPRYQRLFIEGQPGAGKTTFLYLAAAMLAKDLLGEAGPQGESWRKRYLGMDDRQEAPTPLFLKLSELAAWLADPKTPQKADDRFRLLDFLQTTADAGKEDAWREHWQWLLDAGHAILLLDGLDEVADERVRERVFAIFQNAATHWQKIAIIVSSRPFGAERLTAMGFHRTVIEPFGAVQVREFINRWSAALYGHAIGEQPTGEAGKHTETLEKAILDKPTIRKLASNPVMLTCLCVVHWNEGQLPEGRTRVYKAVIRWLLGSREEQRTKAGCTNRFALEAFSAIALTMMGNSKGDKKAIFDLEEAAVAVESLHARHFPKVTMDRLILVREWVRFECLYSGILEETSRNRLRFWHLTFQEYLAAQNLAWMSDDKDNGWWSVVKNRLENAQWRETVDLFPGALFDEGGGRRVDELLTRVLKKYPGNDLAQDARKAGILGRILEPMRVYEYQPKPEIQAQYREVLDRAMDIFEPKGAARVPIAVRLPAAEALGQGGDPRFTGDRWREDLIKVPGTAIALGKYPVTVQEYQRFVEDGGYDNPDYWQEDRAWTFRQAEKWQEPDEWANQLDHPNRPVVGVCWYEAAAYCVWLGRNKGVKFFLPEEKDWETAATPAQGEYPWGKPGPTPELANYGDGQIGAPTPVGLYPVGNGPYGHCDLAGNVWEWCASPGEGDDVSDEEIQKYGLPKVLKGGSWYYAAGDLRAAGRNGSRADYRLVGLGFRVAAPASMIDP